MSVKGNVEYKVKNSYFHSSIKQTKGCTFSEKLKNVHVDTCILTTSSRILTLQVYLPVLLPMLYIVLYSVLYLLYVLKLYVTVF